MKLDYTHLGSGRMDGWMDGYGIKAGVEWGFLIFRYMQADGHLSKSCVGRLGGQTDRYEGRHISRKAGKGESKQASQYVTMR